MLVAGRMLELHLQQITAPVQFYFHCDNCGGIDGGVRSLLFHCARLAEGGNYSPDMKMPGMFSFQFCSF